MDILRSLRKLHYPKLICTTISTWIVLNSSAQICQGSLGDPIINITFGAGQNPGGPLSAATTNYTYVATDCPKDGFYAVRNRTDSCFDNLWYSVTDHTGDPNGYFMIVNASYDPGQFYLDTVKGLCAGNTYEFASWVINISKPVLCWGAPKIILPNVTFQIEKTDGTVLQSYNTNDISSSNPPQWRQYGFFFTLPSGVSDIVLRMINNAPGGCGNDLGLDDITFRPCGPQINPSIAGSNYTTDTLCGGTSKSYTFNAQASPGYNNPTYQWQRNIAGTWTDIQGATSSTYNAYFPANAAPGNYSYRVLSAESGNISSPKCRVASTSTINVFVTDKPAFNISSNSPVCEGEVINVSAAASVTPIVWSGPNAFQATGNNISIPNAAAVNAGTYYATNSNGKCDWKDSTVVQVVSKPVVSVNVDSAKICQGDSVQLVASGAVNYTWSPTTGITHRNASTIIATPASTTNYTVVGSNTEGCSDTAAVFVSVVRKPIAVAGPDRNMLKGTSIQISATAIGDSINYYWTPDYAITGLQSLTPTVAPLIDTSYVLHVSSAAGCGSSEDTMHVTIYKQIAVSNAFSPNGDGINDVWKVEGVSSYPQSEVAIFDRYGREILRRRNFDAWDGTRNGQPLPIGNYYYIIDLRNGSPKLYGWIYLAR
jgi:gliding motility-associated-like protein